MKKCKILSIILSFALLSTSMVGCGSTKDKADSSSISGDDKSPITLTMFTNDSSVDINFDDDVAKKITELTGVTLKITHPVAGDKQAIPLMIASGEYPDLIYGKDDTGKLIDAGALIKLDDYIDKNGKNLKALYGDQINRLKYTADDPSIYTVGTYSVSGINEGIQNPNGNLQIQNSVLKELKYPKIKTLEDYEKALKDYIAKYPEINGKKTIGMSLMASDWRWANTCGNIGGYVAGIPDDGQFKVDDETGEATYKFQIPEVKTYFKWLNHINAEGLLDPESFTQKEDAYKAKITQGIVLGLSDARWDYDQATKTLQASGMDERTFAPLSVTLSDKYKDPARKNFGFSGAKGVGISSSCKDKERAFKFLDWLASDEAQVLLNWGIEGEHYTVENGKRVIKPEVQQQKNTDKDFAMKTGITKYVYPFPQRGDGAVDSNGDTYTMNSVENYIKNYNSAEKETLKAYGAKSWGDIFPTSEELGESKHGQAWQYTIPSDGDLAIIQKKADDYVQKAITQAILGKESDFDSTWDKIQSDLKAMDIEKANKAMTDLVKEKLELWN
ncbi:ABC transporter substrate-binding protein [Clostridium sp. SHJSY1]|uniref:ABC transporter substrate-binding protein n=1 Tax=Clostridium sp. SHJSY1 TaxID=2942483 RepID=UPI002874C583|nr:ABC transporter substrate-binding protein [Clostridium sp. SHJSY1]MDS0527807.1 ABC transporter substrate-binding protein [Clostridium sp. SHJSY1]